MRPATKAAILSGIVEIPLLTTMVALWQLRAPSGLQNIVGEILVGYHALAIPVGFSATILWNPGTSPGPTAGTTFVFWLATYVSQVIFTYPIFYLLIHGWRRVGHSIRAAKN